MNEKELRDAVSEVGAYLAPNQARRLLRRFHESSRSQMMGEGTVNDEELVEVMANAIFETTADPDDSWEDEKEYGYPTERRNQARSALAALRSAGFQVFKPEDCERYHAWDDIADRDGTYFLVPADSGGSG